MWGKCFMTLEGREGSKQYCLIDLKLFFKYGRVAKHCFKVRQHRSMGDGGLFVIALWPDV